MSKIDACSVCSKQHILHTVKCAERLPTFEPATSMHGIGVRMYYNNPSS